MTLNTFAATAALAVEAALPALDPMPERVLIDRQEDLDDLVPMTISAFAEYLRMEVDNLPAECRATARVELGLSGDYEYAGPVLRILYQTLETDDEYEWRCYRLQLSQARSAHDTHLKIEAAKEVLRAAGVTILDNPT